MDIGKNGISMEIFFPTISGYWLLKMGLKDPKILKPTLPKWQLIASTEAALQVSSYKRVFWKHAGNLHENSHVKMWFKKVVLQLYWNHTSTWVFSCTVAENWDIIYFFDFTFCLFSFLFLFFPIFILFILFLFSFCFHFVHFQYLIFLSYLVCFFSFKWKPLGRDLA